MSESSEDHRDAEVEDADVEGDLNVEQPPESIAPPDGPDPEAVTTQPDGEASSPESRERDAAEVLAQVVRDELDEVVPHIVKALKSQSAVADLSSRLDSAEKRLAERDRRPLVSGLRRVLIMVRQLDFEPAAKEALASELERILVGSGYEEFGEEAEPFDALRHDVVDGAIEEGAAPVVAEVLEPGLETLGEVVVKAKVSIESNQEDDAS